MLLRLDLSKGVVELLAEIAVPGSLQLVPRRALGIQLPLVVDGPDPGVAGFVDLVNPLFEDRLPVTVLLDLLQGLRSGITEKMVALIVCLSN